MAHELDVPECTVADLAQRVTPTVPATTAHHVDDLYRVWCGTVGAGHPASDHQYLPAALTDRWAPALAWVNIDNHREEPRFAVDRTVARATTPAAPGPNVEKILAGVRAPGATVTERCEAARLLLRQGLSRNMVNMRTGLNYRVVSEIAADLVQAGLRRAS
jgi:hypothetical protein